jgi:hypothetical protein
MNIDNYRKISVIGLFTALILFIAFDIYFPIPLEIAEVKKNALAINSQHNEFIENISTYLLTALFFIFLWASWKNLKISLLLFVGYRFLDILITIYGEHTLVIRSSLNDWMNGVAYLFEGFVVTCILISHYTKENNNKISEEINPN